TKALSSSSAPLDPTPPDYELQESARQGDESLSAVGECLLQSTHPGGVKHSDALPWPDPCIPGCSDYLPRCVAIRPDPRGCTKTGRNSDDSSRRISRTCRYHCLDRHPLRSCFEPRTEVHRGIDERGVGSH